MSLSTATSVTATTLDLRALRCPLPLLRLKQALNKLIAGDELLALTTDAGALLDIPAFLRQAGHVLLSCETNAAGETSFHLRKV